MPHAAHPTGAASRPASLLRSRSFLAAAALVLILAAGVRVWDLGGPSLWTDEISTEYRAQAPLKDSLDSILDAGNQTPPYYMLLRVLPTSTAFWLRLPSVVLAIMGIALIMFLVIDLYGHAELALWAGALLAVNPYFVWLSRSARSYALVFVLAAVVSYFFLKLLSGQRSRGMWAGYTLGSMAAYFAQLTSLAMPGAQYALFGFIVRKERRFFHRWLAAQVVAAIPTLIWLYLLTAEPPDVKSEWVPHPTLQDLPLTLWNMTAGYDGRLTWYALPALVVAMIGLALGTWRAVRHYREHLLDFYWVWLIIVPWLPVFVVSLFISFYVDRYFVVFLPAIVLLIVQGWMHTEWFPRRVWRGALAVLLIFNMVSLVATFDNGDYIRSEWDAVAAYIEREYQPGDGILLERDIIERTFLREFPDAHPAAAAILQLRGETPDTPVDTSAFEAEHTRIWAIYRNPNEDVHRVGRMPAFDPFERDRTLLGDWLNDRQALAVPARQFEVNGVTVVLIVPESASEE